MDEKPVVKLIGEDGNVFAIIGTCLKAARRAGWTQAEQDELKSQFFNARSYDKVLQLVMEKFNVY